MRRLSSIAVCAIALLLLATPVAMADHTDPRTRLSTTEDPGTTQLMPFGEGAWEHLRNFPPNPGTDLELFRKRGALYAAFGTLGQADEQHVGQRILRLISRTGKVRPRWRVDHGSANCPTANPSGTLSLQHDQILTPRVRPRIMIDTTDSTGRCHDPGGGGLELVDVSRLPRTKFKPREIHLTRHLGGSHTVSLDATRPWIVYSNASAFAPPPVQGVDVLDIRSCLRKSLDTLEELRSGCRPKVFRIVFQPEWSEQGGDGSDANKTQASCHDITTTPGKIYCANLNSTIVLDVRGLTDANGNIKGTPLKCSVTDGTNTAAKVTDCANAAEIGDGQAQGWRYIGHVNHPGRNPTNANNNLVVPAREGVAVAHEAEPTADGKWMFVTDERGGGVVPGGASCANEVDNEFGNGGVHVFDISGGGQYQYAENTEGGKAVFVGEAVRPQATFCTSHVMQQIKGEQRFIIAWYSQGIKIVDWFLNGQNQWTFRETAALVMDGPPSNTWTAEVFKKKVNDDGTVTYWIIANDITRGIDLLKWTGPANPNGSPPPAAPETPGSPSRAPARAVIFGLLAVPLLAGFGRRLTPRR